jgi:hypothetical protein
MKIFDVGSKREDNSSGEEEDPALKRAKREQKLRSIELNKRLSEKKVLEDVSKS